MTQKNPKISESQITKSPKIALFPDDPLVKILKPESYRIVDPYTFEFDYSGKSSFPKDTSIDATDDPGDDSVDENSDKEFVLDPPPADPLSYNAPNLDDITLVTVEKYNEQGIDKLRFTFNVKNHVGPAVLGVRGIGGLA